MSKPMEAIPVADNDWKGWTTEECIKNGHDALFMFCVNCGKPKKFIEKEESENRLKLVESVSYDMEETDGVYEVIDDE